MTRIDLAHLLAQPAAAAGRDDGPVALAAALGNLLAHHHREHGGAVAHADAVRVAAHALCLADAQGHACLPLTELATPARDVSAWRALLAASPVVDVAPATGARPLVLDPQNRLYTRRYWSAECALAARWAGWQHEVPLHADPAQARAVLDRLFTSAPGGETDWQKTAAALALLRPALVLSGGPGTGKTTTIVRIIAAMLALAPTLEIALVAPTGKAAARMQESMREQLAGLALDDAVRVRLPVNARTVHALLGIGADGTRARHHRDNPIGADVVIVDEASMLGLMLATRLFDALRPGARLVLVGDRNQLASVESGIVLATLSQTRAYSAPMCAALAELGAPVAPKLVTARADDESAAPAANGAPARDAVVWLERSHRFGGETGIGRAAQAIHDGDADALSGVLGTHADALWPGAGTQAEIVAAALDGYAGFLAAVHAHAAPAEVLAAFDRYRVLTALRNGPRGAAGLNAAIAQRVRLRLDAPGAAAWYHGRPVIVTRNDALLQVFNGDIGISLADAQGRLAVHFRRADGTLRAYAPGRLDACEDAFALTVHKSQGSEFDAIDVVLPEQPSRIVVRELIYTAVTRARRTLRLWAPRDVLAAGVRERTTRHSGLAQRLQEYLA